MCECVVFSVKSIYCKLQNCKVRKTNKHFQHKTCARSTCYVQAHHITQAFDTLRDCHEKTHLQ